MAPFQSTDPGSGQLGGLLPSLRATGGPRSLMVTAGVVVFGGIAWISTNHYASNPWLFGSLTAGCITLITLLLAQGLGVFGDPKQGEPPPVNLLAVRQSGIFYATGVPSPKEMEPLVRQWLGIQDLPAPAALVKGDARNKDNWKELNEVEGAKVLESDKIMVQEKVKEISKQLVNDMVEKSFVWVPQKEIAESTSEFSSEINKEPKDK